MTSIRRRSLEIPTDDGGMLGRECPRCHRGFRIDLEHYEDRGYMNLRCPYCRFISELDNFTTGEQRVYIYSTTQNLALQTAEELINDMFDDVSGFSNDFIEFDVDADDVDFGRVATASPAFTTEVDDVRCDECGFCYSVEKEREEACPVCR